MSARCVVRRRVSVGVLGVAVAGALAAGCAGIGQSGTMSQRVRSWVDATSMGSDVGTVVGDLRTLDLATREHGSVGVLHTDCSGLSTDAEAGYGELPSPDTQLTDTLNDAYQLAYTAGNDCYDGAGGNTKLLGQSARDRARSVALFAKAVVEVRSTSGLSVSTTTTTSPGGENDFGNDLF